MTIARLISHEDTILISWVHTVRGKPEGAKDDDSLWISLRGVSFRVTRVIDPLALLCHFMPRAAL